MIVPGSLPLVARRRVPFPLQIEVQGLDLTGAVFKMQVRDRKDGGFVRADLVTVSSASAEGVRLIGVETIDDVTVSTIGIRINETTMEAMNAATEIGQDAVIWWDMHITPSGGIKQVYFEGPFTVKAGVTE